MSPATHRRKSPYSRICPPSLRLKGRFGLCEAHHGHHNHFFLNRANDLSNYPTSCMGAVRGANKDFGRPLATPTIKLRAAPDENDHLPASPLVQAAEPGHDVAVAEDGDESRRHHGRRRRARPSPVNSGHYRIGCHRRLPSIPQGAACFRRSISSVTLTAICSNA